MIKVSVSDNLIKVKGHAKYNNYGSDIVCASTSSIIYTTINGILNINDNAIKVTDNNELIIEVISNDEITKKLIANMLILLEELVRQYPKNIKICKGE